MGANPDRNRGFRDLRRAALLGGFLIAACRPAAVPVTRVEAPPPPPVVLERWVDAHAGEGGDGSSASPLKRLGDALAPGATVHLRSGLYPGPFELPPGVKLVGHGEVVLYAEGEVTVVTASEASLEGVSVQGGFIGLEARGPVSLKRVHLSGHRRVAVSAAGAVSVEDSVFEGTVSETRGLKLSAGANASLRKVRFTGAFRRAVDAEDAMLHAAEVTSEGPVEALHLVRTQAEVRQLTALGGRGPGIFTADGALDLREASVTGHEYGLQARNTALTIDGFTSKRAEFAGLATVGCTGTLAHVSTESSGTYGGLQLLESTLTVTGLKVKLGAVTGVLVRKGTVTLQDVTVEQVHGDSGANAESGGDGLELRDAEVTLKNVTVRDVAGSGVFAAAVAHVTILGLKCERCRVGAVVADRMARVGVQGLVSRGGQGPAIAATDHATINVEDADVTASEAPIWAECAQGVQVTVRHFKSNLKQPPSACIDVGE